MFVYKIIPKKGFTMSIKIQFSPTKTPENTPSKPQENSPAQEGQVLQHVVGKVAAARVLFEDIEKEIRAHPTSESNEKRQRITEFAVPLPIPKPTFLPKPATGSLQRDVIPLALTKIPTPNVSFDRHSGHRSVPPPTPMKPTPLDRKTDFEKLHDILETREFRYQGKKIQETIGEGTYCSVYGFGDDSDFVLKAFHGRKTGFQKNHLMKCLKTSAQNYDDVKNKLGLPVAVIHNIQTVCTDHFVIQEKMTADINYLNPDQMRQINQFFIKSIEHKIVIDLQPGNLKLKNETVVLIDFIEDSEHSVHSMVPFICKSWYYKFREDGLPREQALDLLTQLTDGANRTYPYVKRDWLEQITG